MASLSQRKEDRDMIREQIANEFKWSNLVSLSWDDALTLTDKLFSLLRAEIEKVGLSDE